MKIKYNDEISVIAPEAAGWAGFVRLTLKTYGNSIEGYLDPKQARALISELEVAISEAESNYDKWAEKKPEAS